MKKEMFYCNNKEILLYRGTYQKFDVFKIWDFNMEFKGIFLYETDDSKKLKKCKKKFLEQIEKLDSKDSIEEVNFSNIKKNGSLISLEIDYSGHYDLCGYIIDYDEQNILFQSIHDRFCMYNGIYKVNINRITEICMKSEIENKVELVLKNKSLQKIDLTLNEFINSKYIYEIYHEKSNSFLVGKIENFDEYFFKVKAVDLLGNTDSVLFIKRDRIFMLGINTLYLSPYKEIYNFENKYFDEIIEKHDFNEVVGAAIGRKYKISLIVENQMKKALINKFQDNLLCVEYQNGKKQKIDIEYLDAIIFDISK